MLNYGWQCKVVPLYKVLIKKRADNDTKKGQMSGEKLIDRCFVPHSFVSCDWTIYAQWPTRGKRGREVIVKPLIFTFVRHI